MDQDQVELMLSVPGNCHECIFKFIVPERVIRWPKQTTNITRHLTTGGALAIGPPRWRHVVITIIKS